MEQTENLGGHKPPVPPPPPPPGSYAHAAYWRSGEWVRVRVRAGARECTTFVFLVLQNAVNIFVFVGSVASYEHLIDDIQTGQT